MADGILKVGTITNSAGSGNITLPSGVTMTGAGKILQIVQGPTTTETRNSTNVLADTTLTADITPASTSNKVLVMVTQAGCSKNNANAGNQMVLKLLTQANMKF